MSRRWKVLAGLMLLVGAAGWLALDVRAQQKRAEEEQRALAKFMRQKLAASEMVLEGLVTEDFALIEKGAEKLETLSTAEKWRISNDALYRQHSAEFTRITGQLKKRAQEKKLEAASLSWIETTMSCIECHRFVKGMMIAGEGGQDAPGVAFDPIDIPRDAAAAARQ